TGTSSAAAFQAGMALGASTSRWQAGAAFRSRTRTASRGTARFRAIATGDAAFDSARAGSLPPDQGARVRFALPARASAGASYRASGRWRLDAGVERVWWSAFDTLSIELASAREPSLAIETDWTSTWTVRAGVEY